MSTSPSSTPPDVALPSCECEYFMRSACRRETFYKEHDGKRYCVLHYPGTEKKEDFKEALIKRKFKVLDFNFRGVWFPDENFFREFTFSAATDFGSAQFNAATDFVGAQFNAAADFNNAHFNAEVYFGNAHFNADATFYHAQFNANAYFNDAHFNADAHFSSAQFSGTTDFNNAQFSAATDFNDAQFSALTKFNGAHFNADASFGRVHFNADASFYDVHFSKSASFYKAQFNADAYFSDSQFNADADFRGAQFGADTSFVGVHFSKSVKFDYVFFNATVSFENASFIEKDSSRGNSEISNNKTTGIGDAVKAKAETIEVTFTDVSFKDRLIFERNKFAEQVFISFTAATFEKPERAIFHTTPLRPRWFINVDSRKFTFIDVNWGVLSKRDSTRKEIVALESGGKGNLRGLLDITFRQLAVNAEENNRYEEAASFRYMAMEVRRIQRERGVDLFRLSWWYWLLSGYGERVTRAFGALLTIWLLFAVIYWLGDATWWQPKQPGTLAAAQSIEPGKPPAAVEQTQPAINDSQPAISAAPLTIPEALIYSAGVMTLQKPEPLPANKRAKTLVLLETILGPLQAALLALAIRRKFMR